MTEEDDILLSVFESRLRHLLYLYDQLKEQNKALRVTIQEKEETIAKMQREQEYTEAKYANLKLAKMVSINDSESMDAKKRLSKLVRDVDKCIALLNG